MTGTDALARLEPVARPLLADVDRALASLGAPPAHPVWAALRRVGASPADAIRAVADWDPARLRGVAQSLRTQAETYVDSAVSASTVSWQGPAAATFAAHATALAEHLSTGPESMAQRLTDTASYAEAVATWFERTRAAVAGALAEVLISGQAVTLRASADGSVPASVSAAADIAAHLLETVGDALGVGEELPDSWRPRLQRVEFRPAVTVDAVPRSIDVHH